MKPIILRGHPQCTRKTQKKLISGQPKMKLKSESYREEELKHG